MSIKEKYNVYDSLYKRSFRQRSHPAIKRYQITPKYANPIIQDSKQYLVADYTKDPLEENPNCYREKLMKKVGKKTAEKYFERPIDEQIYYNEYLKRWKPQSADDFAMSRPHEDITAVELLTYLFKLPDNSKVALTTSGSHFKNPTCYVPSIYHNRTTPIRNKPTLDFTIPNLYTKMEVSEYTGKICDHAEYFLMHELKKKLRLNKEHKSSPE